MATHALLPPDWDVPPEFRTRLGAQAGRQRAMQAEGHLLLILHELPAPEDAERRGRSFWRRPDGIWRSDCLGEGPGALEKHLDEYSDLLTGFDEREDAARVSADYFGLLLELAPILRAARNMHQALQQAREICPGDRDLIDFRDRAYRIERTIELLYGDARTSLEFLTAKQAEVQAASGHRMALASHRLNVLAAFFFPLATLSSIFGVNLRHGWEDVRTVSEIATAPPPSAPFLGMLVMALVFGFLLKSLVARSPQPAGAGTGPGPGGADSSPSL